MDSTGFMLPWASTISSADNPVPLDNSSRLSSSPMSRAPSSPFCRARFCSHSS